MITSFVRGGGLYVGELDPFVTSICFSIYSASAGVARGMTPDMIEEGKEKDKSKSIIINKIQ